jgi:hypothetical protein
MMFGGATGRLRTHAPHSWFLRLTIAGCLAAGLVSSPASAASSWLRPVNVSRPEKVVVETLSVIVSSQGNATAAWQLYGGEDGIVKGAVRRAGGSWSAPHKLFDDVSDIYASQVAVDPVGNMTAVWDRPEGRTFVVQSATRPPGGSWSAPVNLSKAGAGSALVAVDPEGEATAVWLLEREGGNRSVVQSATRPPGGSWSAPVNLSPVKQDACSPQVALDPQGGATAVWEEEKRGAIQSASRPPGGSWSAPVNLSAAGEWAREPQVAVDSQGDATAVWEGYNPKGTLIQSASRSVGGSWSAPVNLSKPGRNTQEAQIAVGPQGDATAIWARSNGRDLVVQGVMRPAGGSWSDPVDISVHHGQGGFYPRLVVDSWGNATAVWKGYDSNRHNLAIQAATRPFGGDWSPPTDVSNRVTRHMGISEPQIAVDPQGISTVVWVIGARGGGIIQAATSVGR